MHAKSKISQVRENTRLQLHKQTTFSQPIIVRCPEYSAYLCDNRGTKENEGRVHLSQIRLTDLLFVLCGHKQLPPGQPPPAPGEDTFCPSVQDNCVDFVYGIPSIEIKAALQIGEYRESLLFEENPTWFGNSTAFKTR